MFISNNRTSFHLWRKGNLVKDQKVSKRCELYIEINEWVALYASQYYHGRADNICLKHCNFEKDGYVKLFLESVCINIQKTTLT